MRILMIHNHYQQYGGEDAVTKSVFDLLVRNRDDVYLYERSNLEINDLPLRQKIETLLNMPWSRQSYREVKLILREFFKPDVVHVFNTFFTVTPAIYYACKEEGIPVVQSLFNYRLICANALFLRDNRHCSDCLTKSRWRSVLYPCYRNSRILTALVVKMINQHWKLGTWLNYVDQYITVTEFSRQQFIKAGIPASRIMTQPHFLPTNPQPRTQSQHYALYIGRLSTEKGVELMMQAWKDIKTIPLKIMGTGPLHEKLRLAVKNNNLTNIEVLGYQPEDEYERYLKGAKFLVVPSINYDNFPRTIVEAYSYGVPVVTSSLDGIKEFVKPGVSGELFQVGNPKDLADKVNWLALQDERLEKMSIGSRQEFEKLYTADVYYPFLMSAYRKAIETSQKKAVLKEDFALR